jgi:ribonuclease VapC
MDAVTELARFVHEVGMSVIPFGDLHWREAVEAYTRFGKGRHPAALNFGDCLSYSVAKLAEQPLLFVGDDFTQTDIEVA